MAGNLLSFRLPVLFDNRLHFSYIQLTQEQLLIDESSPFLGKLLVRINIKGTCS